jgi:two-component system response regulator FixJ
MTEMQQTVFLVDDDEAMRESMALMLDLAGFRIRTFGSAREFLDAYSASYPGCLVVDLRMPGMTGLELQTALTQQGFTLPTIFLSAYGDVPTTVRAIKGGAVDFLEKPVSYETLVRRIRDALAEDLRQRNTANEEVQIRARYVDLTPREREVMLLVIRGLANKEIARELGISPRTVENHRARVMEKMQANNVAELCRMAAVCALTDELPEL